MSEELDSILALAADYNPLTASLSPDTLAVLFYAFTYLEERFNWLAPDEVSSDITDTEWNIIVDMVATASRELMINMVGQIFEYVGAALPPNVLECDGASYLRVDYPELYAVIDPVFHVDADNFVVPDLRGKVVLGVGSGYDMDDAGGEQEHTLTTNELSIHNHSASVSDFGHTHVESGAIPTLITIGAGVPAPSAVPSPSVTGLSLTGISVSIGDNGSGDPHNNMQPYVALRKVIIAQ